MKYRPDIDGLRTLAIVPVVLFHAGVPFLTGGFVGVDIFFVISGYLITGIVLREVAADRFSFADFYARRFRRIYPMLIVIVACVLGFGALVLSADEFRGAAATAFSSLLAMSNISFWHYQDYFNTDAYASPLLMTWSLGVEEQYYLVAPALLLLLNRLAKRFVPLGIVAIIVVSFAFSAWATFAQPTAAFYLLPSRAWELGLGALIASFELEACSRVKLDTLNKPLWANGLNVLGLGLIAGSVLLINKTMPFPGAMAALPVLGTAALILSPSGFFSRRVLSHRVFVFIGQISYSWYLWHWPIMSYLHIMSIGHDLLWVDLGAAVLSFGFAVLSWKFVEATFRKRTLSQPQVLLRYAGAIALVCICAVTVKHMNGFPQRLSPEARRTEAVVMSGRGDCLAPFSQTHLDSSPHCIQLKAAVPNVVLIGDSHAAALGPGLREAAARDHWGIAILTKSSCPPLPNVTVHDPQIPQVAATCGKFVDEELAFIASHPSIKTVVVAMYLTPDIKIVGAPRLVKGISDLVALLHSEGKSVILVDDVPALHTLSAVHYAYARVIPVRGMFADGMASAAGKSYKGSPLTNEVEMQAPILTKAMASQTAVQHVATLDLAAQLCSNGLCRYADNDGPYFIDEHHLSTIGSRRVLSHLDLNTIP